MGFIKDAWFVNYEINLIYSSIYLGNDPPTECSFPSQLHAELTNTLKKRRASPAVIDQPNSAGVRTFDPNILNTHVPQPSGLKIGHVSPSFKIKKGNGCQNKENHGDTSNDSKPEISTLKSMLNTTVSNEPTQAKNDELLLKLKPVVSASNKKSESDNTFVKIKLVAIQSDVNVNSKKSGSEKVTQQILKSSSSKPSLSPKALFIQDKEINAGKEDQKNNFTKNKIVAGESKVSLSSPIITTTIKQVATLSIPVKPYETKEHVDKVDSIKKTEPKKVTLHIEIKNENDGANNSNKKPSITAIRPNVSSMSKSPNDIVNSNDMKKEIADTGIKVTELKRQLSKASSIDQPMISKKKNPVKPLDLTNIQHNNNLFFKKGPGRSPRKVVTPMSPLKQSNNHDVVSPTPVNGKKISHPGPNFTLPRQTSKKTTYSSKPSPTTNIKSQNYTNLSAPLFQKDKKEDNTIQTNYDKKGQISFSKELSRAPNQYQDSIVTKTITMKQTDIYHDGINLSEIKLKINTEAEPNSVIRIVRK